jgi:ribosome-binding protein aMBF1 (putative translation factor)
MTDSTSHRTGNDSGAPTAPTTAPTGVSPGLVFLAFVNVTGTTSAIDSEFQDVDDVVAADERNKARRPFIEAARQRIAQALPSEVQGVAALRLKKGWSQRRLAQAIGTSQPHIARVESGQDIMLDTARRLAGALDVSLLDIDAALHSRTSK